MDENGSGDSAPSFMLISSDTELTPLFMYSYREPYYCIMGFLCTLSVLDTSTSLNSDTPSMCGTTLARKSGISWNTLARQGRLPDAHNTNKPPQMTKYRCNTRSM
jgi:hypothetical protein